MHPDRIRRQVSQWLRAQVARERESVREYILQEHRSILEIGPALNPFLVDSERVKYFDILPMEELVRTAKMFNYNREVVSPVPIHYCSPTGDLAIINDNFDAVFSSHCIEHCPDLIRHLQAVSNLLTDRGRYFLFIPDKRFCFDHYCPASRLVDALQAYQEARSVHTLGSKLLTQAYGTHDDSARHWLGLHGRPNPTSVRILELMEEYETQDRTSINVHAWHFTPAGFKELVASLYSLGMIDLQLAYLTRTRPGRVEFCAVLAKKDSPAVESGALQQDSWFLCLLQTVKGVLFKRESGS